MMEELDRIPTTRLIDELLQREQRVKEQKCPYCGYALLALRGEIQCPHEMSWIEKYHDRTQLSRLRT
jgi:hypothetical protein